MRDNINSEPNTQSLFNNGLEDGSIIPFSNDIYEKMKDTYISCIPVSMYIKYFRPLGPIGKCHDRSLYMFLCFEDALLVIADSKDLEMRYGKEDACHYFVEIGDYVYEPALLLRFKKDLYYKIYELTNIRKYSKNDYISENKDFYYEVKNTTLQDFMPNGRKRSSFNLIGPLLLGIANESNSIEFKNEVYNYISSIQCNNKNYVKK